MTVYKIADEFVHFCTKCKLNLNHRVTLVDQGRPQRVLCLTCKTERRYSPTKDPTIVRKTKTTSAPKKDNPEIKWLEKLQTARTTSKPYTINATLKIDDVVQHTQFGKGVVVELIQPDKVKIYFREGVKLLKCATHSSLTR